MKEQTLGSHYSSVNNKLTRSNTIPRSLTFMVSFVLRGITRKIVYFKVIDGILTFKKKSSRLNISDLGEQRDFAGQTFAHSMHRWEKMNKKNLWLCPACWLTPVCAAQRPARMCVSMRWPVCPSVSDTHSPNRGGPCSSRHSPGSFAEPEEERGLCVCVCVLLFSACSQEHRNT